MNRVTALVLTLGEDTTDRALESIRRQTLPVVETVIVEGVEPFHRAFNLGVSRVSTELFVQVDADMVLDSTCVADLRAGLSPETAIAAGLLRDELLEKLPAVKLFRTAALDGREAPNTIAPEVDQYNLLGDVGWLTLFVLSGDARTPITRHTFGEHAPSYTERYTWGTYFLLGSRYRYRRDLAGLLWRQSCLRRSGHPMAWIARVAICEGLFCSDEGDMPKSLAGREGAIRLEELAAGDDHDSKLREIEPALRLSSAWMFERLYELGVRLREAQAGASVKRALVLLAAQQEGSAWLAEIALCRGLLAVESERDALRDLEHVRETLLAGHGPEPASWSSDTRSGTHPLDDLCKVELLDRLGGDRDVVMASGDLESVRE